MPPKKGTTTASAITMPKSPFFRPSSPKKHVSQSIKKSPGGTTRIISKKRSNKPIDEENKAGILGTCGNLINSIVGAGVVGIPYALLQTGLVSGILMILLVALMTEKSLRLLVETAKYINVASYEMLFEACFGKAGFVFLSLSMFIMSYGAMISYLMIVKDTLPILLGVANDDENMKRIVLILVTVFVMFPISSQRDMADLAKTSNIAVIFDIILVSIVIVFSPVVTSVEESGGLYNILSNSIINPKTFFIGIGVLSFAFVCQHSSFIIAGSLSKPTNKRWATVTTISLIICGLMELIMGAVGYLTFQENTVGNVLSNFQNDNSNINVQIAANISRALLCTTMICVFPLDVFVTRHVTVVLFFKGRRAHEGDDHAVLARWDRRILLTSVLIISTLIPALIFKDLGPVFAVSGCVGGSCVSYIGPGCTYLGVHGKAFLALVDTVWTRQATSDDHDDIELSQIKAQKPQESSIFYSLFSTISWYVLLMPFWCAIASFGSKESEEFQEEQLLKSPHLSRLAAKKRQLQLQNTTPSPSNNIQILSVEEQEKPLLPRTMSFPTETTLDITNVNNNNVISKKHTYGAAGTTDRTIAATGTTDRTIAAAIAAKYRSDTTTTKKHNNKNDNLLVVDANDENDDDDNDIIIPTWMDFFIAIFFIFFGIIAALLGLICVFAQSQSQ